MRLRKNMKRTAAAVLALSMAVSVVAAPASAGYTIDMSDDKITGNVEIKQETDGSGTKITISVDGKERTAEFTDGEEGDKITITGDNTVKKPAAATTADAEAAKDDTKAPETTVEENKDGTVIDYTGKQDAQPEQEVSRPEGAAPDMGADPAGVDDQQEETDPEADKDDPDSQNDQNTQNNQNNQSGQNTQNEDSEDEDADAGIMTYEAPAPTTLTSAVEAAARKVISIINNATGKELAVTLKNLKVDAGDTAQNALTVSGKGAVTLELDGKNELTGGNSGAKGEKGISSSGKGKLTIQGKEGSSLSTTGGSGTKGGSIGIYANGKLDLVNATVTATGGFGGGTGIYANDDVNIKNSKLTAKGSDQLHPGEDTSTGGGTGISVYKEGKLVVGKGSEVIAIGGDDKAVKRKAQGGIALRFWGTGVGCEVQKGGKLTAIGGNAESESGDATGGNALYVYKHSSGIVSSGETMLIGGNAKSGSGRATGGHASVSDGGNNQVTVKGGTTTALGGKAENNANTAVNGSSIKTIWKGKIGLSVETGGTFVTAMPGERDGKGNGITGDVEIKTDGGKIEEMENAKVVKKDDGTVNVVGNVVGVETGNLKYELTATVEPTCTTPGKRVYTCTTEGHKGEIYEEIISDALGHHFVNGVCTRCGAPESNGGSSAVTLTVTGAGAYETSMADGRYIIAVPAENAVLSGCLGNLKELKAQGVNTLVFRTQLRETVLNIDSMLSLGVDDTLFTLTHSGESAELTVGGFAHNELLH